MINNLYFKKLRDRQYKKIEKILENHVDSPDDHNSTGREKLIERVERELKSNSNIKDYAVIINRENDGRFAMAITTK